MPSTHCLRHNGRVQGFLELHEHYDCSSGGTYILSGQTDVHGSMDILRIQKDYGRSSSCVSFFINYENMLRDLYTTP